MVRVVATAVVEVVVSAAGAAAAVVVVVVVAVVVVIVVVAVVRVMVVVAGAVVEVVVSGNVSTCVRRLGRREPWPELRRAIRNNLVQMGRLDFLLVSDSVLIHTIGQTIELRHKI
ncbi:hypothetical protein ElyMa_000938600 [Elysia marginata]|uniref:Uncharacterized protein n=1 Tax=Elysia marginata TaxID=1093978 RepID=A0AAV4HBB7_9GAST|nr:hypothetical protein ElyMa_000938600 [Elysia marginata]